jgi:low affinity Fe/Cu permease
MPKRLIYPKLIWIRRRICFDIRMANPPSQSESQANAAAQGAFRKFAHCTATVVGSPWAFILASLVIVVWALCGPITHYSDTWQLAINTGTTIVTFLMVFLIQNTQNRDARAMHLKLDELIRSVSGARNRLVDLENLSDAELDNLQAEFEKIRLKQAHAPVAAKAIEDVQEQVEEVKEERDSKNAGKKSPRRREDWRAKESGESKSSSI